MFWEYSMTEVKCREKGWRVLYGWRKFGSFSGGGGLKIVLLLVAENSRKCKTYQGDGVSQLH